MDQAGVIRFVNYQTESLFGYDRDELVGQPIQMLVPEYLWEIYSEHREEYFADPRSRSMGLHLQLIGKRQDGSELPVNISLSHLDTGDALLVITAVREVTTHAQALEDSKLLAAIVENSNDAIIAKTLDGIVTSWNPAAERMYGYSSEEMVGTSIERLSPEGRTGEITSILARIKAGLAVDHFETQRVRKDGTVFPVTVAVPGGLLGAAGHAHRAGRVTDRSRDQGQPTHTAGRCRVLSADNVEAVTDAGIDPLLATGRLKHGEKPPAAPRGRIPKDLTPKQRMSRKLRTKTGKADYSRRKVIVDRSSVRSTSPKAATSYGSAARSKPTSSGHSTWPATTSASS